MKPLLIPFACLALAACVKPEQPVAYQATTVVEDCPPELAARMPDEVTRCTVTITATTAAIHEPEFSEGDGPVQAPVRASAPTPSPTPEPEPTTPSEPTPTEPAEPGPSEPEPSEPSEPSDPGSDPDTGGDTGTDTGSDAGETDSGTTDGGETP